MSWRIWLLLMGPVHGFIHDTAGQQPFPTSASFSEPPLFFHTYKKKKLAL